MLVIGIAGGVASGKSLVTSCFQHLGAKILDADRIGHEVLLEVEVVAAIIAEWGESILNKREIDRRALGRIVFDPEQGASELEKLERITHPLIGRRIGEKLDEFRQDPKVVAVVVDAPVMFKTGWNELCDKVVFVETDIELRLQRAIQRGWPDGELTRREALQFPLDEKRSLSTDIIDNSQSREALFVQVRDLWKHWNLELPKQLEAPVSRFEN